MSILPFNKLNGLLVAGAVDESGEVNISPGPDSVLENNQKLMHIGIKISKRTSSIKFSK